MNTTRNENVARRSFAGRIAGTAVAAALLLGAPVLATLAAAPASADSGITFKDHNGGGFGIGDGGVIFGNGKGDGGIISDKGTGFQFGGLQVILGNQH